MSVTVPATSSTRRLGCVTVDRQAVGLSEVHHRLIVLFGWPKPPGELIKRQVAAVIRAGGVVELLEQGVEFMLVAQRQADGQIQALRARKIANGCQARRRCRDVPGFEHLAFCCWEASARTATNSGTTAAPSRVRRGLRLLPGKQSVIDSGAVCHIPSIFQAYKELTARLKGENPSMNSTIICS